MTSAKFRDFGLPPPVGIKSTQPPFLGRLWVTPISADVIYGWLQNMMAALKHARPNQS